MRPRQAMVIGVAGVSGAAILAVSGFSTDRLVEMGAPYSSLLYPAHLLGGWVLLLGAAALALSRFLPESLPARLSDALMAPSPRVFTVAVFLWVSFAGVLVSQVMLRDGPSDVDHAARLFQARTYLDGRLSVETPPVHEATAVYALHRSHGRTYGKYGPAPSMVYAVSWRILGSPGFANPLLGGLMVACLYMALRIGATERVARITALLLCASPFLLFMNGSLHSHTLTATLLVLALLSSLLGSSRAKPGWLAATGAFLSVALAARPYSAALVGGVIALHAVFRRDATSSARRAAWLLAGALPGVLALLAYNAALTGDPLLTPFHAYAPDEVPWFGYGDHTPAKGLVNTLGLLRILNLNLFGWPSSLLFLPLVAFRRAHSLDRLSIAACLALVVGMSTYFWKDYGFGARFYFEATPFLAFLTARGLGGLDGLLERAGLPRTGHRAALSLVVLFFAFSLAFYLGPLVRLHSSDYGRLRQWPAGEVAERLGDTPSIVIVDPVDAEDAGFASAFLANPLDLAAVARGEEEATVIFARNLGPGTTLRLKEAYPGRRLCHMPHPWTVGAVIVTTRVGTERKTLLRMPLSPGADR